MLLKSSGWKKPIAVMLAGVSLTMLAGIFARDWEESHNLNEITFRSESRLVAFRSSIHVMFNTARHIRTAIHKELVVEQNDTLERDEFISIVENYLSGPEKTAMRSMAWLPKTAVPGQAAFRYEALYAVNTPGFGISPGEDGAANPTHRAHIQAAAESGIVTMDMHLDRSSHQIVSMFLPLYRSSTLLPDEPGEDLLLGIVYSEWDIGVLLEVASSKTPVSGLDFYLHSMEPDDGPLLIYEHRSRSRVATDTDMLLEPVWHHDFEVAEHRWRLSSVPSPQFIHSHPVVLAWIILLFGTILSLGAAFYIHRVGMREALVERQVTLRTRELEHSQQSLKESQRIARLGGWEWTISTGELKWSDEVYRLFGYEPQAFAASYERFLEAVHPDDRGVVERAVEAALQGDKYDVTHRILLPDGVIRFVHEQGRVEYDEHNVPVRMLGTVQDITEQRRAERRLHRLAMALSHTVELVVITNREGIIRYVNHAFEKVSGYSSGEVLGKRPNLVKSGRHPDEYYAAMWKKISRGKSWSGSFTNRKKSGDLYEVEQTISPIFDPYGEINGYVAIQRDVTEERKHQAKMEHTQRLESLGVLAGGIAHDFNNLLTSIMGNISLARRKQRQGSAEVITHLERVEKASESAAELCRQMLAYSGQGNYLREWFDLNEIIQEMTALLQVTLSKKVTLKLAIGPCNCMIHGDKSQVQQVVMNLVINASEAIEETGRTGEVHLSTRVVEMGDNSFENCFYHDTEKPEPGPYLCLTVSDNGCGMDDETRLKMFDPFFTTKFAGRGLGTSAILGIVKSHHGALAFETEVDRGTTFRVYFPCRKEQAVTEESSKQAHARPQHTDLKGKTVLLIDDEETILETTGLMLEELGCEVKCTASATEGIDLYAQNSRDISLVILDMTMPEMDGLACAARLFEINANAPIVLSSGYSREVLEELSGSMKFSGFLQKPYFQNQLATLVQDLLGSSPMKS